MWHILRQITRTGIVTEAPPSIASRARGTSPSRAMRSTTSRTWKAMASRVAALGWSGESGMSATKSPIAARLAASHGQRVEAVIGVERLRALLAAPSTAIVTLTVIVPDEHVGAVIADVSTRRGIIKGTTSLPGGRSQVSFRHRYRAGAL